MSRENHWFRRSFDSGLRRTMERARQAQEDHDRRIDVQLRIAPLVETDLLSPNVFPGSVSTSGAGEPPELEPIGALAPGSRIPEPSPAPLTDRIKLETIANSAGRVRATLIRLVDAGIAPNMQLTIEVTEFLESVSAYARAERIVRPAPDPQSIRVDPPTLRVVK